MKYIKQNERIGLTKINNNGSEMKIINVLPDDKIIVQFQDEFACTKEVHWNNFKKGNVMNPYDRKNGGVGYIGEGKYKTKVNGRNTRIHNTWNDMLSRCYSETKRNQYIAYENCDVCEEWHNFQVFAKWYEENYYSIGNGRMHLDKDIIYKENYLYAPERCIFVPQKINMIFMQKPNKFNLPSGISLTDTNKYHSSYNGKGLGNYDTLEDAIFIHDEAKRKHIKTIVNEYGTSLPDRVRNALLNW